MQHVAGPDVVVVGPPGSGKTTVGRILARRLDVPFVDADAVVVERAGKPIAQMFLDDGEDAFRSVERDVVAAQLAVAGGVLALGGGAVLDEETRRLLRGHTVLWLTVGLADGLRRTGMSTARPLLAGVNPRATFRSLLEARAPLYREVATVEVTTDRRSPNQVARAALEALGLIAADSAPDPVHPDDPDDRPTPRPSALLPSPTLGVPTTAQE